MKRFRAVPTSDAIEGMRLHEDIRDRAGNVLLPRQAVLSAATIASLLRRDIPAVLVVDDSATPEQLAAARLHARERIAHLCRHVGGGRANAMLRAAVEAYRMGELP